MSADLSLRLSHRRPEWIAAQIKHAKSVITSLRRFSVESTPRSKGSRLDKREREGVGGDEGGVEGDGGMDFKSSWKLFWPLKIKIDLFPRSCLRRRCRRRRRFRSDEIS